MIVDDIFREFEALSGAILNRDRKSKVMGLRTWKRRSEWPLKWLKSEEKLTSFGIIMSPDLHTILDDNW